MATSGTINIAQAVSSLARLIADQGGSSTDSTVERVFHDTAWRLLLDMDQQVMHEQNRHSAPCRLQLHAHYTLVVGRHCLMIQNGKCQQDCSSSGGLCQHEYYAAQLVLKCKQCVRRGLG